MQYSEGIFIGTVSRERIKRMRQNENSECFLGDVKCSQKNFWGKLGQIKRC
jgi:hypothetical protein